MNYRTLAKCQRQKYNFSQSKVYTDNLFINKVINNR